MARTTVSIFKECSLRVDNFYLERASASVPQTIQNGSKDLGENGSM